ncbi:MAG: hypothetical protein JF614_03305 [Acidobacteria bacterium]|nr:hypothetical protein [Acidobacteriota bacterium]
MKRAILTLGMLVLTWESIEGAAQAAPNVKISVQWGSSNVGSTQYGPKLTAYIAVKNTSKQVCHPPHGAKFVVGAYYKTLGLVKATSVGPFPTVINPGETKNFIAQSLDDPHQAIVYKGYVDFYVSSQTPGQPDLSAAVRPACQGEVNLNDNNAHSVKKVITNP